MRLHHKQTEVAAACAQAVWHVEQFVQYFQETGKFRYKPIVPGGNKPREEFDAEIEAIMKTKPTTAIAVRPAAVVTIEASASERRELTADFEKAWMAFGRNFLVLGETVLHAEEAGMSVDDLIAVTGLTAARSTAYAARKATKLWRIFQPFAEPAGILLDCESQFRDFPADLDLTPPEARKIVKLIEKEVEPDKRGQHRPTREQLKPIIAATVGLRRHRPRERESPSAKAQPSGGTGSTDDGRRARPGRTARRGHERSHVQRGLRQQNPPEHAGQYRRLERLAGNPPRPKAVRRQRSGLLERAAESACPAVARHRGNRPPPGQLATAWTAGRRRHGQFAPPGPGHAAAFAGRGDFRGIDVTPRPDPFHATERGREGQMSVNAALMHEARELTTGANVHKIRGAVAMYRAAVDDPTEAGKKAATEMERDLVAYLARLRAERARAGK